MNLGRYDRQTILKDFGPEAQQKLADAKVLVVGAGGLGLPVLTYLNAMGAGTLGIVDNDEISLSNLHRQVLYGENEVGQSKVAVAIKKLKAQNSNTKLIPHTAYLTKENALEIISQYDVVVDATDNFPTRYLINDVCVILKKPFVYGALHGYEGQVSVFNFDGGPTYRCLYPNMPKQDEVPNCNEHGVLGIIPGIIGNFQALETVKVITEIGEPLSGKLLLYNGLSQSLQKIKFQCISVNLSIQKLRDSYDFECAVEIPSIEPEHLLQKKNISLIDVRTAEEFREYHLPNSISIPLSELENWLRDIDFETTNYFICQSGTRSRKAIEQLQKKYPNASMINVRGGLNNCKHYVAKY